METNLEVVDGVGRGEPGGAGILLGAEGPVEGLGDGAQVEGTHCGGCDAVAVVVRGTESKQKKTKKNTLKKKQCISKMIFRAAHMLDVFEGISEISIMQLCTKAILQCLPAS